MNTDYILCLIKREQKAKSLQQYKLIIIIVQLISLVIIFLNQVWGIIHFKENNQYNDNLHK
jgi:hypothetical protein